MTRLELLDKHRALGTHPPKVIKAIRAAGFKASKRDYTPEEVTQIEGNL